MRRVLDTLVELVGSRTRLATLAALVAAGLTVAVVGPRTVVGEVFGVELPGSGSPGTGGIPRPWDRTNEGAQVATARLFVDTLASGSPPSFATERVAARVRSPRWRASPAGTAIATAPFGVPTCDWATGGGRVVVGLGDGTHVAMTVTDTDSGRGRDYAVSSAPTLAPRPRGCAPPTPELPTPDQWRDGATWEPGEPYPPERTTP